MTEGGDILLSLHGWTLTRQTSQGPLAVLRDIDLELRRGEWLAVTGANGSGKTSLLRWLAAEESPLSVQTGLVFQEPDDAFLAATVAEELALGRQVADVGAVLREHDLEGRAGVSPRALSAGEKQRLGLAIATASAPEVLLCDEPTALQDCRHAAWLLERLRQWRTRTGAAVVFTTQRRDEALLADRLLVLAHGRQIALGAPEALLKDAGVAQLLAVPFGQATPPPALAGAEGAVVARWQDVGCAWPAAGRGFAGVNLELRAGDRVGLTGASGAGKSTLLACAVGLRRPDQGRCLLGGRTLCARGEPDLDHGLALLAPQFPEQLFTQETVRAEVELDPALGRRGAPAVLAAAGLPAELAERHPLDLSSGQQRRLAVALVALAERDLLLFDEPTVGLDPQGARQVAALLRAAAPRAAVVVASHDRALLAWCGLRVRELGPAGLVPGG